MKDPKTISKPRVQRKSVVKGEAIKPPADLNAPKNLAGEIVKRLDEKKAVNPVVLDVGGKTIVADYFVVASARSTTAVRSLAEHVMEKLQKENEIRPLRREGVAEGRWAALDYGGVIVHIFHEEARSVYQLEKLWE